MADIDLGTLRYKLVIDTSALDAAEKRVGLAGGGKSGGGTATAGNISPGANVAAGSAPMVMRPNVAPHAAIAAIPQGSMPTNRSMSLATGNFSQMRQDYDAGGSNPFAAVYAVRLMMNEGLQALRQNQEYKNALFLAGNNQRIQINAAMAYREKLTGYFLAGPIAGLAQDPAGSGVRGIEAMLASADASDARTGLMRSSGEASRLLRGRAAAGDPSFFAGEEALSSLNQETRRRGLDEVRGERATAFRVQAQAEDRARADSRQKRIDKIVESQGEAGSAAEQRRRFDAAGASVDAEDARYATSRDSTAAAARNNAYEADLAASGQLGEIERTSISRRRTAAGITLSASSRANLFRAAGNPLAAGFAEMQGQNAANFTTADPALKLATLFSGLSNVTAGLSEVFRSFTNDKARMEGAGTVMAARATRIAGAGEYAEIEVQRQQNLVDLGRSGLSGGAAATLTNLINSNANAAGNLVLQNVGLQNRFETQDLLIRRNNLALRADRKPAQAAVSGIFDSTVFDWQNFSDVGKTVQAGLIKDAGISQLKAFRNEYIADFRAVNVDGAGGLAGSGTLGGMREQSTELLQSIDRKLDYLQNLGVAQP